MHSSYILPFLAAVALAGPVALPPAGSPSIDDAGMPPRSYADPTTDAAAAAAAPGSAIGMTGPDGAGMPPGVDAAPFANGGPNADIDPVTGKKCKSDKTGAADAAGAPGAPDAASAPDAPGGDPSFVNYPVQPANAVGYGDSGGSNNTSVDTEQGTEPATCEPYEVQPGDTCFKIAEMFEFSVADLLSNNEELDENCTNLITGEELCITPPVVVMEDLDGGEGGDAAAPTAPYDVAPYASTPSAASAAAPSVPAAPAPAPLGPAPPVPADAPADADAGTDAGTDADADAEEGAASGAGAEEETDDEY